MKLVSLEIHGFKSFADRVKLRFDEGITGIVGPNGCGKSNVVDAIRWVLGEQKTRNLRSDKMENVLFNGTEKRKRAAMAEVVMTFENTRNVLPTDFSTVAITRRLYQGGESEYLLNGVPCRLKDITNLFMDTGIGPDSYAIIELGMVEDLLTDKQNARRQLFEEAAGIGKYKQRKKETFARLADTQQSLERVEDLLHELDKNLRSLEKQAERARQYTDVKEAYRTLSTQAGMLQFEAFNAKLEVLDDEAKGYEIELSGVQAHISQLDSQLQAAGKTILEGEQALSALQRNLNQLSERIQQRENDHARRNERARYLTERRQQLDTLLATEAARRTELEVLLAQGSEALTQAESALAARTESLVQTEAELATARLEQQTHRDTVTQLRSQVAAQENTLREMERSLERYEAQLQALQRELQRSHDERSAGSEQQAGYGERIQQLRTEMATAEAQLQTLQQAVDDHAAAVLSANRALEDAREAQFQAQRKLDAKEQELKLTQGLVESLEGFSESVRWLKQHAPWAAKLPLVSDLFSTGPDLKVALEAVLEPWLSHIVVPTQADALRGVQLLQEASKGKAPFLVLEAIPHKPILALPAGSTPLLAHIEYDAAYEPLARWLFGAVVLVEGLPPGVVPEGITYLTHTGTLVACHEHLRGGSVGLFEGKRVGRARTLEKLRPEVEALRSELDSRIATVATANEALKALQGQHPSKALSEAERAFQLLFRQLSALQAKEDEYQNFLARVAARATDLEQQMADLGARLQQTAPQRAEAARTLDTLRTQLAEKLETRDIHAAALSELEQSFNQATIARLTAENARAQLLREQEYRQGQLSQLQTDAHRQRDELAAIAAELEKLGREGQLHDEHIVTLYEERRGAQRIIADREQALLTQKQANEALATHQRQLRNQVTALLNDLAGVKDRATEVRIAQGGLRERLQIEFMVDIAILKHSDVFREEEAQPLDKLEAGVLQLREQLARFGPVNTTAIEAFEELKERHTFITQQRADLQEARTNLMTTIEEMDSTARARFEEAFAQIRENFIKVFRTLFTEHDKCDLRLTNPEDPLESPIEIFAQPKGKRPLTINQLSGGEKTLTATSLLFAIYLLKPAPFCVFDEVDAPLDDANVDKFTHIITEFSRNSQFIVVTHNKRTMAKTRVLYGVTMEETGVSRLLPVDLVALNLN